MSQTIDPQERISVGDGGARVNRLIGGGILGVVAAGVIAAMILVPKPSTGTTPSAPLTECQAAEKVFDMYQADVADGVVSSIKKVQNQAQRLRLLGCPGWQY